VPKYPYGNAHPDASCLLVLASILLQTIIAMLPQLAILHHCSRSKLLSSAIVLIALT
jgi:hypothetical protein